MHDGSAKLVRIITEMTFLGIEYVNMQISYVRSFKSTLNISLFILKTTTDNTNRNIIKS